ncbi:shikimate dehydrogenase family protein [Limibacterium fermenti]|uniref:shikimate dehydrogenase family protein n=1 Tax=Limibacterium fermenti TaxID=3229863 RepID=UPI000E8ACF75|nr:shikimate dehydrogenase [Porphyromonadaceae bacterium]
MAKDIYGLIGFPLKHSFSARFFAEKFERENIDAEYRNFEIEDILQLREVIEQNRSLKGLNVTIPYKERVLPLLDGLSPEAQRIGAVNVIRVERASSSGAQSYRLTGYNTDYVGFKQSLEPLLEKSVHRKALLLGTGGASKAVAHALADLGLKVQSVSRTAGKDLLTYSDLNDRVLEEYKVIVNASPVGTFPQVNNCPDIPYQNLTPHHLLYDLVYNPAETLFLKKGKDRGATVKNGAEMLERQALEAWKIWTA